MLRVMTPLWGTKHSSALVGDKSGGDRRAARSLLSCALWRGMGRLWRGMGGMGRPEPLSAHRPHQQQGLSGFHETRDPRPGYCQAHGKCQREFRGFHETRITRHESRITAFIAARSLLSCVLWRNGCAAMVWLWSGCGACGACGAAMAIARHGRPWSGMGGILPPRQCPRSRQPFSVGLTTGLHFSPRGEAKCVRGPSGRGARRLARAGVLEQYIEHGKQAQRSHGGHTTCFDRRVVRHAGLAPSHGFHESRDTKHESRPFFACFDRRVVRNAG